MTVKQQVLEAIQRLPDDIDYRDVSEEVAFLAAIREAERDIQEGRVISNEQMKATNRRMDGKIVWTERASNDIEAIVRYIARRDPSAATRIGVGIYERAQILLHHPQAGSTLDELVSVAGN